MFISKVMSLLHMQSLICYHLHILPTLELFAHCLMTACIFGTQFHFISLLFVHILIYFVISFFLFYTLDSLFENIFFSGH